MSQVIGLAPSAILKALGVGLRMRRPSWGLTSGQVRIRACQPSFAVLRHNENANGWRPALSTRPNCSPLASTGGIERYAWLGQDRIAYQVLGEGPPDLVMTGAEAIDVAWEDPGVALFLRSLASVFG
jgi:hypothetical protein